MKAQTSHIQEKFELFYTLSKQFHEHTAKPLAFETCSHVFFYL